MDTFLIRKIEKSQYANEWYISKQDLEKLCFGNHNDPFSILGFHWISEKIFMIRSWIKDGETVQTRFDDINLFELNHHFKYLFEGVFEIGSENKNYSKEEFEKTLSVNKYTLLVKYRNDESCNQYEIMDPYVFGTILPARILDDFQKGFCLNIHKFFGSQKIKYDGLIDGFSFCVWAPNAANVSIVGTFNDWDGTAHPMRLRVEYGVWELFIPTIINFNDKYLYEITDKNGHKQLKIDLYVQEIEDRPNFACIISEFNESRIDTASKVFSWNDRNWMEKRRLNAPNKMSMPMSIYEIHLSSWKRGYRGEVLNFKQLAHDLVNHCLKFNFTHVEFLPITYHPFDGSWGYQIASLFAVHSRMGTPYDLKYLINALHEHDIGVLIDFVPAHFAKDAWAISYYDGTACYEYSDPRERDHPQWGTSSFNFKRNEVRSYILGAVLFWFEKFHIDGIRIDAVSAMIYRDHARSDWIPNEFDGNSNLEAVSLLKEMNNLVNELYPDVYMIAEESTEWKDVTRQNGLNFDLKWDLGWMNDILKYLSTPPTERAAKHQCLTFRCIYVGKESWILPLSHDEVVNGKGSLVDKCGFISTDFYERLCTMKVLIAFQICLQGRPLIFMGTEWAQGREWNQSRQLDWHESEEPLRRQFSEFVRFMLKLYKNELALHKGDDQPHNFEWIDCNNSTGGIIAFMRKWMNKENDILVICNFSGLYHTDYVFGVHHSGDWLVLSNSDDWAYGGQMRGLGSGSKISTNVNGRYGFPHSITIDIAPNSAILLKAPGL